MKIFNGLLILACAGMLFVGPVSCGNDDDTGTDTDADSDTDGDTDSDTDTDADSDSDGDGGNVVYAASLTPSQDDVSGTFEYDAGTFVVYQLPGSGADYTAAGGASIDQNGLTFDLDANSLLTTEMESGTYDIVPVEVDAATIKVFDAPLSEWTPPFDYIGLDAVYFIDPYFGMLAEGGVAVSMEAPSNWSDGDTGTTYMLGDYNDGIDEASFSYLYQTADGCVLDGETEEKVEIGHLADCGPATYDGGRVLTSAIPRLGWVGVKKDDPPAEEYPTACIASLTGILVDGDGNPIANQKTAVQICDPNCSNYDTDADGRFLREFNLDTDNDGEDDIDCIDFDFSPEEELQFIHLTINNF